MDKWIVSVCVWEREREEEEEITGIEIVSSKKGEGEKL